MDLDLDAAIRFVATHARVIDRRRMSVLLGDTAGAAGVVAALDAYRNPDGGYGWALEPDHRSATSQPVAAMHALELLADIRDVTSRRPVEVCDWLAEHALADGGIPFGLPHTDTVGSADHWTAADASVSSVQMTAQLAGQAHRLARLRPDMARHPWLVVATDYCLASIENLADPSPYELMFLLRFLDAVSSSDDRAERLAARFGALVITDGPTPVPGGADGEVLHILDFTPYQDAPSRAFFSPEAVSNDLKRLAGQNSKTAAGRSTSGCSAPAPPWSGADTRPSKRSASSAESIYELDANRKHRSHAATDVNCTRAVISTIRAA
ncbi:MAG: hypothetical protein LBV34_07630 [Nocardiopsaceae bacterium]|jgi:hypothetical protein|nr:hypothetical protein [Nocardiopsaceae bacterium]